ncbi:hypothetical protein P9112_007909 [Eukaryota sp. TZLM1-RC]
MYSTAPLLSFQGCTQINELTVSSSDTSSSSSSFRIETSTPKPSSYSHSLAASRYNIIITVRSIGNTVFIYETNLHHNVTHSIKVTTTSEVLPSVSIIEHRGRAIDLTILFSSSHGFIHKLEAQIDKDPLRSSTSTVFTTPIILPLLRSVQSYPLPLSKKFCPRQVHFVDATKSIISTTSHQLFMATLSTLSTPPSLAELTTSSLLSRASYSVYSKLSGASSAVLNKSMVTYRCLGTDYLIVINSDCLLTLFSLRTRSAIVESKLYESRPEFILPDASECHVSLCVLSEPTDPCNLQLAVSFTPNLDHLPIISVFSLKIPTDPKKVKKPLLITDLALPDTCQGLSVDNLSSSHGEVIVSLFDSVLTRVSGISDLDHVISTAVIPKFSTVTIPGYTVTPITTFTDWIITCLSKLPNLIAVKNFLRDFDLPSDLFLETIKSVAPSFPLPSSSISADFLPHLGCYLVSLGMSEREAFEKVVVSFSIGLWRISKVDNICGDLKLKQVFFIESNGVYGLRRLSPCEHGNSMEREMRKVWRTSNEFISNVDYGIICEVFNQLLLSNTHSIIESFGFQLSNLFFHSDFEFFPVSDIEEFVSMAEFYLDQFRNVANYIPQELLNIPTKGYFLSKSSIKSSRHPSILIANHVGFNIIANLFHFLLFISSFSNTGSIISSLVRQQLVQNIIVPGCKTLKGFLGSFLTLSGILSNHSQSNHVTVPQIISDFSQKTPFSTPSAEPTLKTVIKDFLTQRGLAMFYNVSIVEYNIRNIAEINDFSLSQCIFSINCSEFNPVVAFYYGVSLLNQSDLIESINVFSKLAAKCFNNSGYLESLSRLVPEIPEDHSDFWTLITCISELFYNTNQKFLAAKFSFEFITSFGNDFLEGVFFEKLLLKSFKYNLVCGFYEKSIYLLNLVKNYSENREVILLLIHDLIKKSKINLLSNVFLNPRLLNSILNCLNSKLDEAIQCLNLTDCGDRILDGIIAGLILNSIHTKKGNYLLATDSLYKCSLIYNNYSELLSSHPKFSLFSTFNFSCAALNSLYLANHLEGRDSEVFLTQSNDVYCPRKRRTSDHFEINDSVERLKQSKIIGIQELNQLSSLNRLQSFYLLEFGSYEPELSVFDLISTTNINLLEELLIYCIQTGTYIDKISNRVGEVLRQIDLTKPENQPSIVKVKKLLTMDSAEMNYQIHSGILRGYLSIKPTMTAPFWLSSALKLVNESEFQRVMEKYSK